MSAARAGAVHRARPSTASNSFFIAVTPEQVSCWRLIIAHTRPGVQEGRDSKSPLFRLRRRPPVG